MDLSAFGVEDSKPAFSSKKKLNSVLPYFEILYFLRVDEMQKLRENAANRNQDEFYFKMIRTKTVDGIHKHEKTERSYKQLEARRNRLNQLEKIYMDMSMQKELHKNGRKRKLREDEIVCPTTKPVYKWCA
ncbi:hypothetical protein RIF29_26323 [Crotalaria pallida]|uniref:Uncharacterized protein n=1 Tax=Crotalaria pallida TaxID=3830 RepID=A0AAN9I1M3_CROPI